jgi:hypothetical protein
MSISRPVTRPLRRAMCNTEVLCPYPNMDSLALWNCMLCLNPGRLGLGVLRGGSTGIVYGFTHNNNGFIYVRGRHLITRENVTCISYYANLSIHIFRYKWILQDKNL